MSEGRPAVDVVVPFAGSAAELAALMTRFAELERRPGDTLTIVDNRARGPRWPVPEEPDQPVVLGARERPGSYFARNAGARLGSAPWIVFLDADVRPPPGILDHYFSGPIEASAGVLAGAIRDATDPTSPQTATTRFLEQHAAMSQANTVAGERPYAQTANCAVRREAFQAVGGFREEIRSGGDADLCFRLAEAGWTTEARPEAEADHLTRTTLTALVRQRARHGSGAAWLDRAHPGAFPAPSYAGLLRWGFTQLASAGFGRREFGSALVEVAFSWSFALGRVLPNELRARRPVREAAP